MSTVYEQWVRETSKSVWGKDLEGEHDEYEYIYESTLQTLLENGLTEEEAKKQVRLEMEDDYKQYRTDKGLGFID